MNQQLRNDPSRSWIWPLGWYILSCANVSTYVYTGAQGNNLLLVFMLSRVEVSSSFSSHPGGVLTTTSGAHRGVGYSVASFPGPPSSGALPTPQGNSLSVPSTVMICGCVMCVDCYVTVYAVRW